MGISAQINLAPSDYKIARLCLEHELAKIHPFVDEVVLTNETRPGFGRFSANWETGAAEMAKIQAAIMAKYPKVRRADISYSMSHRKAVAEYFGQKALLPLRDYRGGPFYAYFFGLYSCANDVIFHLDSDMLFGGDAGPWFQQALKELADPNTFAVSPLPGPPTADGTLRQPAITSDSAKRRYTFQHFSTRVFMTDRRKLLGMQFAARPKPAGIVQGVACGHPAFNLPERTINRRLARTDEVRVDLAGDGLFWSLHPLFKSERYIAALPELIARVEAGDMPEAQRGLPDIHDALFDQTQDVADDFRNRWWRNPKSFQPMEGLKNAFATPVRP
jgi:hypothetical protein